MTKYYYQDKAFIIEEYDQQKTFASFLPGVAGVKGIPMWVYYVNRGQGIAGFGFENKDGGIMDFVPANQAYRRTALHGFRTFLKLDGQVTELFSPQDKASKRRMEIGTNSLKLVEERADLDLKVEVSYFTITNQPYGGLVRKLRLLPGSKVYDWVELLDGLPLLWPYKNDNFTVKNLSNLAVAWFDVYNLDKGIPYFRNRSTTADSAAVGRVEAGHFYASYSDKGDKPLPILYDPDLVFGHDTAFLSPLGFLENTSQDLLKQDQVAANKMPCAFTLYEGSLQEPLTITSLIGKMSHVDVLNEWAKTFSVDYFLAQEAQAITLGQDLVKDVASETAYPTFDAYVQQTYLDNLLRGGYPLVFEGKDGPIVYHVFSRIHGDMEREYNEFYVEPAYYSHGNGNFRDVNQNRRNDVFFVPEAGLYNIKQFMDLLQLDGQNPLTIKGSHLRVSKESIDKICQHVGEKEELLRGLFENSFTPGGLMQLIIDEQIPIDLAQDDFLKMVMKEACQENQAAYGHGYWVDHWTYNMDLIDNYLNVFPERIQDLLFTRDYQYFVSPEVVLPRAKKYVLTADGKPRQYDAICRDESRINRLGLDPQGTNWEKGSDGSLLKSTLYEKLLIHSLNKMMTFDQSGLGLMMDTDKPGWNDAMNGLPGLFGSSTNEVVELRRIVSFLLENQGEQEVLKVPSLIRDTFLAYAELLDQTGDELGLWEAVQDLREGHLENLYQGRVGEETNVDWTLVSHFLNQALKKINAAIEGAKTLGNGILPSYLVHEASRYELIPEGRHPVNGLPTIQVFAWSVRALPHYLEAPARYLKQLKDPDKAKKMHAFIKDSQMYDEKLGMYVTSLPLDHESLEIGRARAFTPGWLERESVFMHMEYKYLLGLFKAGLYEDFFEAIKSALPPFMDPAVYGRSTLENSSFIASSRNPNPANHGRGFVSRLTGTTSEMISMWLHMMTGSKLFSYDGELGFTLSPKLSRDFFKEDGTLSFTIFGKTKVTYQNPARKDTFGPDGAQPVAYKLWLEDEVHQVEKVTGALAQAVRAGQVKAMEVVLK